MFWPEYRIFHSDAGGWAGNLSVVKSHKITIRNNLVYESYGEGIGLFGESSDCLVENNEIYASRALGIYVGSSWNNTVRKNLISGTNREEFNRLGPFHGTGIGINDEPWRPPKADNNIIEHNYIAYCSEGIWIGSSHKDAVFSNSIIRNNTIVGCGYSFI